MTRAQVEINKLQLLRSNPRTITKDQMQKLCESMKKDPKFLEKRPVLVNQRNGELQVYAGNQRVQAAKRLKWKTICCDVDIELDDETMKERVIKDNKTYGDFDYDLLANTYDISTLLYCGFTEKDLDLPKEIEEILNMDESENEDEHVKTCPHCNGIL